jgi:hypothetical protein
VREAVERIAASITTDEPAFVVGVLLGLSSLVEEAVKGSGHSDTPWRCLPFAVREHRGFSGRGGPGPPRRGARPFPGAA